MGEAMKGHSLRTKVEAVGSAAASGKRPKKTGKAKAPAKASLVAAAGNAELTPQERAICEAHYARQAGRPCPPFKVTGEGKDAKFEINHPNPGLGVVLMMSAVGTASPSFLLGLIEQLAALRTPGTLDEDELNFAVSVVKGINPRDEVEGLLAAQMAAVHLAVMRSARHATRFLTAEKQQTEVNALNKFARTFAAQVDALKRYRANGEQVVKVQHVVVNDGGQAIVGNVQHGDGGGGARKIEG